ncbi:MAG: hypothetical protein ABIR37_02710 [Candidatus Saccharimonadales bacterium]
MSTNTGHETAAQNFDDDATRNNLEGTLPLEFPEVSTSATEITEKVPHSGNLSPKDGGEFPVVKLPTTLAEDYPHFVEPEAPVTPPAIETQIIESRPQASSRQHNKWLKPIAAGTALAAVLGIGAVAKALGSNESSDHKTTPAAVSTRTPGNTPSSTPSSTETTTPSPTETGSPTSEVTTPTPTPSTETTIGADGEHLSQTNEIIPTEDFRNLVNANAAFAQQLLKEHPQAAYFSSKEAVDTLNGSGVISKKNIAAYFANLKVVSAKPGFRDTIGTFNDVSAETYPMYKTHDDAAGVLSSNYMALTLHRVTGSKKFGPHYYDLLSLNPLVTKASKNFVAEQLQKNPNVKLDDNTYSADVTKVINTYDVALNATEEVTVIETYSKYNGPGIERLEWTALFKQPPEVTGDTADSVMGVNVDVLDISSDK